MSQQWAENTIVANSLRQHYYRTGGNKPPLILLHGFSENALCWASLARSFENEYDLITLDARGHGLSGGPENGYSPEILVEDIAAFIHALGLTQKPYLLGHSNGALYAAGVAARYPLLVRGVVLEDPPWGDPRPTPPAAAPGAEPWPGYNAWFQAWKDWHIALRTMTPDERIASAQQSRFLPPGSNNWPREELLAHLESQAQFNLDVLNYTPPVPSLTPWRETVERIECPILLLTADPARSMGLNAETLTRIAAAWRNPRSRYHFFEGIGHFLHREMQPAQFDQFVTLVKDFLKEI